MSDQVVHRERTDGDKVFVPHVDGGNALRVCLIGTDGGGLLFFSASVGCREGKGGRAGGMSERGIKV